MDGSNETIRGKYCYQYQGEISIEMDESTSMLFLLGKDESETTLYELSIDSALKNAHLPSRYVSRLTRIR